MEQQMFTAKSFLGLLEKLPKAAIRFITSVCPSVILLPSDRSSCNFISEYFSKLCQKIKLHQPFCAERRISFVQGAGFDSQTTQNMRQPITAVLARTCWSFCPMFLLSFVRVRTEFKFRNLSPGLPQTASGIDLGAKKLRSGENSGYCSWRCTIVILAQFFLVWEMFETNTVEKSKTHVLGSVTFFPENLAFLWDNVEK